MAQDFGDDPSIGLYSDASATIAISQRGGPGKLRNIQTQYLWIHERVSHKELDLAKAHGASNPADMLTKPLAREVLSKHMEYSALEVRTGRSHVALQI